MKMRLWTAFGPIFCENQNRRGATKPKARASHYAAERLESRLLFTTNSWKFDNGGDWDTASLWSLGHVPTATEDVTIPLGGTYTITHNTSATDSFKSLTSTKTTVEIDLSSGSLTQAGDNTSVSQVSGTFIVGGGATFSVTGGTFTASGPTTLSSANLSATGSGQILFSGATTLSQANLSATAGGQLSFPGATSYTNGSFTTYTIAANGVGSRINLSNLATFSAGPGAFNVNPTAGGEIDLSGAVTGTTNFTLADSTSTLNVGGVTSLADTNVTVSGNATVDFSSATALTRVNLTAGSTGVGATKGSILFPAATSFSNGSFTTYTIAANGVGSKINLSDLATFSAGPGTFDVNPTAGGEIDLSGAGTGTTNFTLSDATSILNVAGVTSLADTNVTVSGNATADFSSATALTRVNLTAGSTGVGATKGSILFPAATSFSNGSFTTYTIAASGAGSKINLSDLATFSAGPGTFNVNPTAGGEIDLSGAVTGTANFTLSDATSILNVAGVTSLADTNVTVSGNATVDFSSVTALTRVNLTAGSTGVGATKGSILFPVATSFSNGSFTTYTIAANGAGSKINLSGLATFSAGPGTFNVNPTAGGEIDLSGQLSGTVQFNDTGGGILVAGGSGGGISAITISGTGSIVKLNPGFKTYTTSSLSITSGGTLDLADNELIINYGNNADPNSAIRQELTTGYNGGAWNGTGIDSSEVSTHHGYALGYADGADGIVSGLSSGQLEITYTLYGDLNLDGVVSGVDFTSMVGYLGTAEGGWDQSDFNYDGVVSGQDFTLLIGNLGKHATAAAVVLPASGAALLDATAPVPTVLRTTVVTGPAAVMTPSHLVVVARPHRRGHR